MINRGTGGDHGSRRPRVAVSLYLLLSLTFGCVFTLLTPPLAVPDESRHIGRALEVSRGHLLPENSRVRTFDADRLRRIEALLWPGAFEPAALRALLEETYLSGVPPTGEGYLEVSAAAYPPVPYLLSALAFLSISGLGLGIAWGILLARLLNVTAATILTSLAIRTIPFGKWILFWAALLPMTVFQCASVSADSLSNAICFVWIAVVLGAATREDPIARREWTLLCACVLLLALVKSGYVLLAFLCLLIPRTRFASTAASWFFRAGLPSVALAVQVLWLSGTREASATVPPAGVDPVAQLSFLTSHPTAYATILLRSIWEQGIWLLKGVLGIFGYLDTYLPMPVYALLLATGLAAASSGSAPAAFPTRWRRGLGLLALASVLIVALTLPFYLTWTPVGSPTFAGVQGRYFLPAVLLALLGTNGMLPDARWSRLTPAVVTAAMTFSLCAGTAVLIRRYHTIPAGEFLVAPWSSSGPAARRVVPLHPGQSLEQRFRCPVDRLLTLSVPFATYSRVGAGTVRVSLHDGSGQELGSWTRVKAFLNDNDYVEFSLPGDGVDGQRGRELILRLSSPGSRVGNAVGVYVTGVPYYEGPPATKPDSATATASGAGIPERPYLLISINARPTL